MPNARPQSKSPAWCPPPPAGWSVVKASRRPRRARCSLKQSEELRKSEPWTRLDRSSRRSEAACMQEVLRSGQASDLRRRRGSRPSRPRSRNQRWKRTLRRARIFQPLARPPPKRFESRKSLDKKQAPRPVDPIPRCDRISLRLNDVRSSATPRHSRETRHASCLLSP
jgi:hypothetical protein